MSPIVLCYNQKRLQHKKKCDQRSFGQQILMMNVRQKKEQES